MKKIFLLVLSIFILTNPIMPCGMITHTEISHRAMHNFLGVSKETGKDYKKMILENASFFMAGSPFPDWGYACQHGDAAEATHWPPFIHAYLKYVKENYANDPQRQNELYSFLFGIESHGISDVIWHWGDQVSGSDQQGFLHSMGHMASNCNDDWTKCHGPGDTGGDMYLSHRGGLRWFSDYWTAPIDDLDNIYTKIGVPSSRTIMTECVLMMFIGARLEALVSIVELTKSEKTAAFLSDDLDLWFHGGLDDMSMGVVWQWENLMNLIEKENPQKMNMYMQRRNKLMKVKKEGRKERKKIMKEILSEKNVEKFKILMGAKAVSSKPSNKNNKPFNEKIEENNKLRFLQKEHLLSEDSQNCLHDELSSNGDVHFALDETKISENKLAILEIISETIFPDGSFKDMVREDLKFLKKHQLYQLEDKEKINDFDHSVNNTKSKSTPIQTLNNIIPYSYFGKSLTYGDFDGDGVLEVAIGAPGHGSKQTGAVYLGPIKNFRNDTNILDLNPKDEPLLQGESEFSRFGFSLTTVDLNHDGIDDLVVSAPTYGNNGPSPRIEDYYPKSYQGRIYVYFGVKGKGIDKNAKPDLIIEPKLTDNTTKYFNLGYKLNSGDCDGDGYADLLIGSPYSQQGGDKRGHAGIFTNINKNSTTLNLHIEDADFSMSGSDNYEEFGYSMMCQNKTVFIGAPGYRSALRDHQATGGVFAYDFVNKTQKFFIFSDKQQARFGASMDIKDDLIVIGAPSYSIKDNNYNFHNGVVFFYSIISLTNDKSPSSIHYLNNLRLKIYTETHRARFGKSVKLTDDKIYISAPMISYDIHNVENGKVFIFDKIFDKTGELKTDQCDKEIDNKDLGARLGDSLIHPLKSDYMFVTAPYTLNDEFCGRVFILKNDQ
jgi:glycosylphosphatidylinositol phospholipase D